MTKTRKWKSRERRLGPRTVIMPGPIQPKTSWWAAAGREDFTKQASEHTRQKYLVKE